MHSQKYVYKEKREKYISIIRTPKPNTRLTTLLSLTITASQTGLNTKQHAEKGQGERRNWRRLRQRGTTEPCPHTRRKIRQSFYAEKFRDVLRPEWQTNSCFSAKHTDQSGVLGSDEKARPAWSWEDARLVYRMSSSSLISATPFRNSHPTRQLARHSQSPSWSVTQHEQLHCHTTPVQLVSPILRTLSVTHPPYS